MRRSLVVTPLLLASLTAAMMAAGQPSLGGRKRPPTAPTTTAAVSGPTNLRSHIGTEQAGRLIRSTDPEERLRGIERAASIGTPEAIALLVESLERSPGGSASSLMADPRALITMARGLARFADQERARSGLQTITKSGNPAAHGRVSRTTSSAADDEGDPIARAELARQIASIALARGGGDRALEQLYAAARQGGSGQQAALTALAVHPPRDPGFFGTTGQPMPVPVVKLLGELGDLRAIDVLNSATRSSDINVRCAALVSLAQLGDERAGPLARTAIAESDVRLRAASGEVFILLAAPERFKATTALIADDATTLIGLGMAERVFSPEITKLVAARANEHPDREVRAVAIRALGRSPDPGAAKALVGPQLLGDPELAYSAINALARSPAPNARDLIAGLLPTRLGTLAIRAHVVRAIVRGERGGPAEDFIAKLASSNKPERALAIQARVALGDADVETYLHDKDARIRRAALMGSLARGGTRNERALLEGLEKEPDPSTRTLMAIGLLGGDPEGSVTTATLVDRSESGGGDASLAAYALARRADTSTARKLGQLLAAKEPVLRAHIARGLAYATLPDATGRLADAYAYETEPDVRRAIITALAQRTVDKDAPLRQRTLAMASELDPDGPTRNAARRTVSGSTTPFATALKQEVAWLRVVLPGGEAPGEPFVGSVVRADGVAVPIAFDEEGYALVAGLPPGGSRLVLAPRLPTDKGRKP